MLWNTVLFCPMFNHSVDLPQFNTSCWPLFCSVDIALGVLVAKKQIEQEKDKSNQTKKRPNGRLLSSLIAVFFSFVGNRKNRNKN